VPETVAMFRTSANGSPLDLRQQVPFKVSLKLAESTGNVYTVVTIPGTEWSMWFNATEDYLGILDQEAEAKKRKAAGPDYGEAKYDK